MSFIKRLGRAIILYNPVSFGVGIALRAAGDAITRVKSERNTSSQVTKTIQTNYGVIPPPLTADTTPITFVGGAPISIQTEKPPAKPIQYTNVRISSNNFPEVNYLNLSVDNDLDTTHTIVVPNTFFQFVVTFSNNQDTEGRRYISQYMYEAINENIKKSPTLAYLSNLDPQLSKYPYINLNWQSFDTAALQQTEKMRENSDSKKTAMVEDGGYINGFDVLPERLLQWLDISLTDKDNVPVSPLPPLVDYGYRKVFGVNIYKKTVTNTIGQIKPSFDVEVLLSNTILFKSASEIIDQFVSSENNRTAREEKIIGVKVSQINSRGTQSAIARAELGELISPLESAASFAQKAARLSTKLTSGLEAKATNIEKQLLKARETIRNLDTKLQNAQRFVTDTAIRKAVFEGFKADYQKLKGNSTRQTASNYYNEFRNILKGVGVSSPSEQDLENLGEQIISDKLGLAINEFLKAKQAAEKIIEAYKIIRRNIIKLYNFIKSRIEKYKKKGTPREAKDKKVVALSVSASLNTNKLLADALASGSFANQVLTYTFSDPKITEETTNDGKPYRQVCYLITNNASLDPINVCGSNLDQLDGLGNIERKDGWDPVSLLSYLKGELDAGTFVYNSQTYPKSGTPIKDLPNQNLSLNLSKFWGLKNAQSAFENTEAVEKYTQEEIAKKEADIQAKIETIAYGEFTTIVDTRLIRSPLIYDGFEYEVQVKESSNRWLAAFFKDRKQSIRQIDNPLGPYRDPNDTKSSAKIKEQLIRDFDQSAQWAIERYERKYKSSQG